MKWLWQTITIFVFLFIGLISGTFVLKLAATPRGCEVNDVTPQKGSIQNNNFYGRVFGNKSCAPRKAIFKIPVIQRLENSSNQSENTNSPEIITILSISKTSQSFYIRRIDELANGLHVSTGHTCVAWKWLEQERDQTLIFSLQRNLQIYDPAVSKIIFIISLPAEFQQSGTSLSIERSVLQGLGNNYAGEIIPIELNDISPMLTGFLEPKYKSINSSAEQYWAPGTPILEELNNELIQFTERIGVYVDTDVQNIKDNSDDIKVYETLSEKYSCEIPKDL